VNEVLAGGISGVIMAHISIVVGALALLSLSRDPPARLKAHFERVSWVVLTVPLSLFSIALWSLLGAVLGILYRVSLDHAPGGGLGSPNQTYTLAILLATAVLAAPWLVLLRHVLRHLLVISLAFVGIFGWLLPYFSG